MNISQHPTPGGVDRSPQSCTVAIAQCGSVVGDVSANLERARILCEEARARQAHLILFPECHATGYSYRDLRSLVHRAAEPFDGAIPRRLSALAREFDLVVCCGMLERDGGRFFVTHVVAFPDGRLERQRKGVLNEIELPVLGIEPRRSLFEWNGLRFGILVCADVALPSYTEEFHALGIQLLLHPSAGRMLAADRHLDHQRPVRNGQQRARALRVPYAVSNACGFSGEDDYPGNSWIIDASGDVLVHLPVVTDPAQAKDTLGVGTVTVGA